MYLNLCSQKRNLKREEIWQVGQSPAAIAPFCASPAGGYDKSKVITSQQKNYDS
jgi:hypothetical protein